MEDRAEDRLAAVDHQRRKLLTERHWVVTVAVAVLPCMVTSFFTYRQAKMEAQAKVQEAHIKAEAGYDALVKAVEQLQKQNAQTVETVAKLSGHVDAIETLVGNVRPRVDPKTHTATLGVPVTKGVRNGAHWKTNFPPPVAPALPASTQKIDLPASLDQAAAAKK